MTEWESPPEEFEEEALVLVQDAEAFYSFRTPRSAQTSRCQPCRRRKARLLVLVGVTLTLMMFSLMIQSFRKNFAAKRHDPILNVELVSIGNYTALLEAQLSDDGQYMATWSYNDETLQMWEWHGQSFNASTVVEHMANVSSLDLVSASTWAACRNETTIEIVWDSLQTTTVIQQPCAAVMINAQNSEQLVVVTPDRGIIVGRFYDDEWHLQSTNMTAPDCHTSSHFPLSIHDNALNVLQEGGEAGKLRIIQVALDNLERQPKIVDIDSTARACNVVWGPQGLVAAMNRRSINEVPFVQIFDSFDGNKVGDLQRFGSDRSVQWDMTLLHHRHAVPQPLLALSSTRGYQEGTVTLHHLVDNQWMQLDEILVFETPVRELQLANERLLIARDDGVVHLYRIDLL